MTEVMEKRVVFKFTFASAEGERTVTAEFDQDGTSVRLKVPLTESIRSRFEALLDAMKGDD